MGDKSPKSRDRAKNQKDAAKTQVKTDQAKRQQSYSTAAVAATKKK